MKKSIKQIAEESGLSYKEFQYRMQVLNLLKHDLSDKNIKKVVRYKKKEKIAFTLNNKIKVIEYYLTVRENKVSKMAKDLNFSEHKISETINEFLLNKGCLIAESKINKL